MYFGYRLLLLGAKHLLRKGFVLELPQQCSYLK